MEFTNKIKAIFRAVASLLKALTLLMIHVYLYCAAYYLSMTAYRIYLEMEVLGFDYIKNPEDAIKTNLEAGLIAICLIYISLYIAYIATKIIKIIKIIKTRRQNER